MDIQSFKKQSILWEAKFWISTIILVILIVVAYIYLKSDFAWNNIYDWIGLFAVTIIGVIGSLASTFSFFFALRIAYDSIISSNQNEIVLNRLDSLISQTNKLSNETNLLTKNIADSTLKSIPDLQHLFPEIEKFLNESENMDELVILLDAAIIGQMHLMNPNFHNLPDSKSLQNSINRIQSLILERSKDVKHFKIATLSTKPSNDDNELINYYIKPFCDHHGISHSKEIIQTILSKHHDILAEIKINRLELGDIHYENDDINTVPFQFFYRRNGDDRKGIFILAGTYNLMDIYSSKAMIIDHDEHWLENLKNIYQKLVEFAIKPKDDSKV
jgi:hypothetical protein